MYFQFPVQIKICAAAVSSQFDGIYVFISENTNTSRAGNGDQQIRESFTITDQAPSRAISWLKLSTSTFTKMERRQEDMKLGTQHKDHN